MKLRFKIRHLLLLTLIVSVGLFLQLGLNNTISSLKNAIVDADSSLHDGGKQQLTDEYPHMMATAYGMTVENVALKTTPSITDYFLFRRTMQCTYKLDVKYMRREMAHGRIPRGNLVDGYFVDVPSQHKSQQSFSVTATPFGYEHHTQ